MENLKADFERFSKLHSWYKHNNLFGTTFYVFQAKGEQARNGINSEISDLSGIHWHFEDYLPKNIITPIYEVKFNCFLRGIELNSKIPWGFWIIYKDYKNVFDKWILDNYPQWKDIDWESIKDDTNNNIIKEIYQKEYEKCWNNLYLSIIK